MENIIKKFLDETTLWVPRVIGVIVIILCFFVLSKILKSVITKGCRRFKLDIHLTSLITRTSSTTMIIFGFVTILGTLGINVSALVAGLGLTGFALGFALKDIISNILSGVLILLYRPFKIGNTIKVAGYEGIVVSIDLRYTELISEGNKMLIPNSKLFTEPITVLHPEDSLTKNSK
ncbi:mechanosensitive ion channel domain-containing protein [Oceanispirochaeta sp.]|jgi:small conductance mechanosensitive channel|uniref:mechanosensitive ion channel family protein n=1 Tax=Oceanispirochaeta sp. TaxID=2035350 RepID=UPI00260E872A|nr:mechanosensitive ion channel domain-containing protein [Oceanispirochaeta sp.]MDA3956566.1 mechanosensitive ion channel [Oceanispirochaeta sp.]